jgi:hypothetical protein
MIGFTRTTVSGAGGVMLAVIEGGAMKKLQVDGLDILVDDTFEIPNGIMKVYKNRKTFYVAINSTYLHRLVINAKRGQIVDHINGNGLDNRSENLRISNFSENRQRSRHVINQYRGVSLHRGKFQSKIWFKGQCRYIGTFSNALDAARAYDCAARQLFGEHAFLNNPT